MRRISISLLYVAFVFVAPLHSQAPKKLLVGAECAPPTTFGTRTLLIHGRLNRDKYKSGEYLFTSGSSNLFVQFTNLGHPLRDYFLAFSKLADREPLSVHVEADRSDEVELENDRVFIVHGKLTRVEGIFELEATPEANDNYDKTVISLVSGDKCLLGRLAPYIDTRVRLLLRISTGT